MSLCSKLVALTAAALLAVNPVSAKDVEKVIVGDFLKTSYKFEEVVVKAKRATLDNQMGVIRIGLSNEVLNHIYDEKTDTWKYVQNKAAKK